MVKAVTHPDPPASEAGFTRVSEPLVPWIARDLGYFGRARFVCFYYEPRGDEVIWRDGQSYGFGTGGWSLFTDKIAPVARAYGAQVGSSQSFATDVLLIDRSTGEAYFAERKRAEQFLARQAG